MSEATLQVEVPAEISNHQPLGLALKSVILKQDDNESESANIKHWVVSKVKQGSPLSGKLREGDSIMAVNDTSVVNMSEASVFQLIGKCKMGPEGIRLTVVRTLSGGEGVSTAEEPVEEGTQACRADAAETDIGKLGSLPDAVSEFFDGSKDIPIDISLENEEHSGNSNQRGAADTERKNISSSIANTALSPSRQIAQDSNHQSPSKSTATVVPPHTKRNDIDNKIDQIKRKSAHRCISFLPSIDGESSMFLLVLPTSIYRHREVGVSLKCVSVISKEMAASQDPHWAVCTVTENSPFYMKLEEGDILVSINGVPVSNLSKANVLYLLGNVRKVSNGIQIMGRRGAKVVDRPEVVPSPIEEKQTEEDADEEVRNKPVNGRPMEEGDFEEEPELELDQNENHQLSEETLENSQASQTLKSSTQGKNKRKKTIAIGGKAPRNLPRDEGHESSAAKAPSGRKRIKIDFNLEENWEKYYQQLSDYMEITGQIGIPTKIPHDKNLQSFVESQRRMFQDGTIMPDRLERLKQIGLTWCLEQYKIRRHFLMENRRLQYLDKMELQTRQKQELERLQRKVAKEEREASRPTREQKEFTWERHYQRLVEFKNEYKHCRVPQKHSTLGIWVTLQRQLYKYNKLPANRVESLNKLGFEWATNTRGMDEDEKWEFQFNRFLRFKRTYGHTFLSCPPDAAQLVQWAAKQRGLNENKMMREDRRKKLDDIGFRWIDHSYRQPQNWDKRYQELVEFKNKNNHCRVPITSQEDFQLGHWVCKQRRLYSNDQLPDNRVRSLELLGFDWGSNSEKEEWDSRFEELSAYKKRCGHFHYLRPGISSLGGWAQNQRELNRKSKLTEDRRKKLDDIGFNWELERIFGISDSIKSNDQIDSTPSKAPSERPLNRAVDPEWAKSYRELVEYRSKYKMVPSKFLGNPELIRWVRDQRLLYKEKKLPMRHVRRLERLGFEWVIRDKSGMTADEKWELRFQEFVESMRRSEQNQKPISSKPMAKWASRQRLLNKQGLLGEDRRRKLDGIGFIWGDAKKTGAKIQRKKLSKKTQQIPEWATSGTPANASKDDCRRTDEQSEIESVDPGTTIKPVMTEIHSSKQSLLYDVTLPPTNKVLGLVLKEKSDSRAEVGTAVSKVLECSPLHGLVQVGDWLRQVNATSVAEIACGDIPNLLREIKEKKETMRLTFYRSLNSSLSYENESAIANPQTTGMEADQVSQNENKAAKSREEKWYSMYSELITFFELNGHTNVSRSENKRLSNWVYLQRQCYRKKKMSTDKIERLHQIDFEWSRGYATYYDSKTSDCPVVEREEADSNSIDIGASHNQPDNTSGTSENAFPMVEPKTAYELWNIKFEELVDFYKQHGHPNVPSKYKDNPTLGRWVKRQKERYRKKKLPITRVNRLNELGFEWWKGYPSNDGNLDHCEVREPVEGIEGTDNDLNNESSSKPVPNSLEELWNIRYKELLDFREKYGHCDVPRKYNDNLPLANWVDKQRQKYRKNKLSDDQRNKLTEIGFESSKDGDVSRDASWERRFKELLRFYENNGHADVPQVYHENPQLGRWVQRQRHSYRKNTLSSDRFDKLNAIDFAWWKGKSSSEQ